MAHAADPLLQPGFYDHPVDKVELIETHISRIYLAGDYAYKLKKPLNLGFLDFSTLAKRKEFCEQELRLNRRYAPQLYLAVRAIGGDPPQLDDTPAVDYLVQMRRFAQDQQLDRRLAAGRLGWDDLEPFAALLARLHRDAPATASDSPFGTPDAIREPVAENFRQIRPLLPEAERGQLSALENWSYARWEQLRELFNVRKAAGFIRDCHGDLHLANMTFFRGEPILFDCIEFNDNLRFIDRVSDLAFLLMDLDDRKQPQLAIRFLNQYLQQSGDYRGLPLLRFYQVYRALVRAKVACLRLNQPSLQPAEGRQILRRYHSYLSLAAGYTKPKPPLLLITHGLSGSGKTSFARELAPLLGAIHLQSDIERKRLFGLAAQETSGSPIDGGIYTPQASAATYKQLRELAELCLGAGFSAIVDASFLKTAQRAEFIRLAEGLKVSTRILDFQVDEAELRRRIEVRMADGKDASEANLDVLEMQLRQRQPLSEAERGLRYGLFPSSTPQQAAGQLAGST